MSVDIRVGDCLEVLATMPDESVHCVVTSPPYHGLRAYLGDPGMIGLEPTFDEHLVNLVAVFKEVRRVLRKDGTLWLNYGDAYANKGNYGGRPTDIQFANTGSRMGYKVRPPCGFKEKDLMMMSAEPGRDGASGRRVVAALGNRLAQAGLRSLRERDGPAYERA